MVATGTVTRGIDYSSLHARNTPRVVSFILYRALAGRWLVSNEVVFLGPTEQSVPVGGQFIGFNCMSRVECLLRFLSL